MPPDNPTIFFKRRVEDYFKQLQNTVCSALERLDGRAKFSQDGWAHQEGGGGRTRILQNGNVFERAGVNFSGGASNLTEALAARLGVDVQPIFATGTSLVL